MIEAYYRMDSRCPYYNSTRENIERNELIDKLYCAAYAELAQEYGLPAEEDANIAAATDFLSISPVSVLTPEIVAQTEADKPGRFTEQSPVFRSWQAICQKYKLVDYEKEKLPEDIEDVFFNCGEEVILTSPFYNKADNSYYIEVDFEVDSDKNNVPQIVGLSEISRVEYLEKERQADKSGMNHASNSGEEPSSKQPQNDGIKTDDAVKGPKTFEQPYKHGKLVLTVLDQASLKFGVSYKTTKEEKPILSFTADIMDTRKYGYDSVGYYDCESDMLGEVAHQMHANFAVKRNMFPFGVILCCSYDFKEPDDIHKLLGCSASIRSVALIDTIASLCIQYLRSIAKPATDSLLPLYFVYYGKDRDEWNADDSENAADSEEDADPTVLTWDEYQEKQTLNIGRAMFDTAIKSKKYCVFRCVAGLSASESCYLAVACETKDPRRSDTLRRYTRYVRLLPSVVASDEDDNEWTYWSATQG